MTCWGIFLYFISFEMFHGLYLVVKLAKCARGFFPAVVLLKHFPQHSGCLKGQGQKKRMFSIRAAKVYFPLLHISCIFRLLTMQSLCIFIHSVKWKTLLFVFELSIFFFCSDWLIVYVNFHTGSLCVCAQKFAVLILPLLLSLLFHYLLV